MRVRIAIAFILTCLLPSPSGMSQAVAASVCRFVAPKYSPIARQAWIQGDVVLRVRISDGLVKQVDTISGNAILAEYAVNAVRTWQFCTDSKVPANDELTLTIQFRLDGGGTDSWAPTEVMLDSSTLVRITTAPPAPLGPDVIEKKQKKNQ